MFLLAIFLFVLNFEMLGILIAVLALFLFPSNSYKSSSSYNNSNDHYYYENHNDNIIDEGDNDRSNDSSDADGGSSD